MKTEIKLEEIVCYLPYGLKFYVFDDPAIEKKYLKQYPNGNSRVDLTFENFKEKIYKDGFKPILHPLSDLTKEIEVNGEKFVPNLHKDFNLFIQSDLEYFISNIHFAHFFQIKKLYQWHFDIHNLIERGLAIDINTLKQ
jgi:hypothetical protein